MRQPTGNPDVVRPQQNDTRPARQWRHAEAKRRLRCIHHVAPQLLLAAVHRAHQSRGSGGPLVLAGALVRPPAGLQPVLRLREVVGQAGLLGLLLVELHLPARDLGAASGLVAGEAVSVDTRAAVLARVQVENRRGDVGQQRPVVADHDYPARMTAQPVGEERQAGRVEVVGGLIQ